MGPNNVWDLKTNSRGTQTDLVAERTISECLTELKSTFEFQDLTYRLSKSYQDEPCLLITPEKTLGLLGMPVDPITVCVTASGMCSLSVVFLPVQTINIMQNGQISLRLFRSILRKLNGRAGYGFCPGFKEDDFSKDFDFDTYGLEVLQQPFTRIQAKDCAVFYQCQKLRSSAQPLGLELCPSCWKAAVCCRSSLEDPDGKILSWLKVPALQAASQHGKGCSLENRPSSSEHSGDLCNGKTYLSSKSEAVGLNKEERTQGCLQPSETFKPSSSVTQSKTQRTHSKMLKRDPTSPRECQTSDKSSTPGCVSSAKLDESNTVEISLDAKMEASSSFSLPASRDTARRDVLQASESCGIHRPVLSARIKPFRTLQNLLAETGEDVQEIIVSEASVKSKASEGTNEVEMMTCLESEPSGASSETVLSPYDSPQPLCIDEDADVNEEPDSKRSCFWCSACHQAFISPADLSSHLAMCSQQIKADHPVLSPIATPIDTAVTEDGCMAGMMTEGTDAAHTVRSKMCPVCNRGFPSKPDLESHLVQKHGAKLHPCRYCGQKFALKSNLSAHLQLHRGTADLECKECGAKFVGKKAFAVHIKKHMGSHPHFCMLCSKFFGNISSYEKHMERHKMRRPVSMLSGSERMVHSILGKAKRCLEEKVQMTLPNGPNTEGIGSQPGFGNFCKQLKDHQDGQEESMKREDCTRVDSVGDTSNFVPNSTENLSSSLPKPTSCTSVSAQDLCHIFTASGVSGEHGIAASANLQLLSAVSLAQAELDGSISSGSSQKDPCFQQDLNGAGVSKKAAAEVFNEFIGTSTGNLSQSPLTTNDPGLHSQIVISPSKQETEQMTQLGTVTSLESGRRVMMESLSSSLKERLQLAASKGEGSKILSKQEESAAGSPTAGRKASATSLQYSNSASNFDNTSEDKALGYEAGLSFKEQQLEKNVPEEKVAVGESGLSGNKHQSELLQRLVAPPLVPMEVQEGKQTPWDVARSAKPEASCGSQEERGKISMEKATSVFNQPNQRSGQDKDAEGKAGDQPQGKQLIDPKEKQKAMVRKLLAQLLQNRQWAGGQEDASLPGEIRISRHELETMLAAVNVTGGATTPGQPGFRQPLPGSIQASQRFKPPCGPSPAGLRVSIPFTGMRPPVQSTGPAISLGFPSPRRSGEEVPRFPSQLVDGSSIKSNPNDKHPLLPFSNHPIGTADDREGHTAASASANSHAAAQPLPSSTPRASTIGAGSILEQMMKLESLMPQSAKEFLPSASCKTSASPSLGSHGSLYPNMEKSGSEAVHSELPACKRAKKTGKNQELRAALGSREKSKCGDGDSGSQSSVRDSKHSQWSGGLVKEKSNRVAMMVPPSEIDRLLKISKHRTSPVSLDNSSGGSQPSPQSPNVRCEPSPSCSFAGISNLSLGTSAPSSATLGPGLNSVPASPSSPATPMPSRQMTPTSRSSTSLPGSPRPVSMPMPPLIPAVEAFGPPPVPAWLSNVQMSSSSSSSLSSLDAGDSIPIDLTKPDKRPPPQALNENHSPRDRQVSPQGSGILSQVLMRPSSNGQAEKERDAGAGKIYLELTSHTKRSSAGMTNEGVTMPSSFPHSHAITMPKGRLVLRSVPAAANARMCALPVSSSRMPLPHEDAAALRGQTSPPGMNPQQRSLPHPLLTPQGIASQNVCLSHEMSPAVMESPQTVMHPQVMSASQSSVGSPLTARHKNLTSVLTNASAIHNSATPTIRLPGAPQTTLMVPNFLLETSPFSRNTPGSGKGDSDPACATPFGGFKWHRPHVSEAVEGNLTDDQESGCCGSNKVSERDLLGQLRETSHHHANKEYGNNARPSTRTRQSAASNCNDQAADASASLAEESDRTSEWRQNFINALHQTRRQRPSQQQPPPLTPDSPRLLAHQDVEPAQQQGPHPRRTGTRQPRGRKRTNLKHPHMETTETTTTQQQVVPSVLQQEDCWTAGKEGRAASERRYILSLSHVPTEIGVLPPAAVSMGNRSQGHSSSGIRNIASSADPSIPIHVVEQVNKSGQTQPRGHRQRGEKYTDKTSREETAAEDANVKAEPGDDYVRCSSCGKCFYSEEAILEHECDSP